MFHSCLRGLVATLFLFSIVVGQQDDQGKLTVMEQKREDRTNLLPSSLAPFRKNYILLGSIDSDLSESGSSVPGGENEDTEVKFQVSLRTGLGKEQDNAGFYFAYTALSHWQVYDWDHSSTFRTTDHEPELYFEHWPKELGYRLGLVHQSNGEGGSDSRSWNRFYVEGLWRGVDGYDRTKTEDWGLALKLWHAFAIEDNNEDIEDYLGVFELRADWLTPLIEQSLLSCVLRENFQHHNSGIELDWSLPIWGSVRVMAQYSGGYGESLLDYAEYANRIGFGFEFSP